MSAESQDADPASMLAFSRRMIALRKASPALTRGAIALIDTPEPILAFTRTERDETVLCVFNMSAEEAQFSDTRLAGADMLPPQTGDVHQAGDHLKLGAQAARIFRL